MLDLAQRDLFDEPAAQRRGYEVVADYPYVDEHGTVLFVVERRFPKDFRQRRPDGSGGWSWRLGDVRRVLYLLPDVLAAARNGRTVYVTEGEKDVDALVVLGHTTTCNSGGAGKWRDEYAAVLAGAEVVVIADRDAPGREHARTVAAYLTGTARSVRVVEAKAGKDAADHVAAGHGAADLVPVDLTGTASTPDDDRDEEQGEDRPRRSQATRLVELARESYRLLSGDDGRPYAVSIEGPNIALPLRGRGGVREQLAKLFADRSKGTVPSASALTDALAVLEGHASAAEVEPVALRLARHGAVIVLDLGTADGRCVVDATGWRAESTSPVLSRRTALTSPLPDPARGGDLAPLRTLLNVCDDGWSLLLGWAVAALIPHPPHPILALLGEQGTAKSTTARLLVDLIDPSPAPLRSCPRDIRQWAVTASSTARCTPTTTSACCRSGGSSR